MLIPIGEASQRFNGMIHLTDTARFIWQQVDKAENLEGIVTALTDEYEVTEEQARCDVYGISTELYKRGMVTDIPELKDVQVEVPGAEKEQTERKE